MGRTLKVTQDFRLLKSENSLIFQKRLAKKFGHIDALFLQQVHYWLEVAAHKNHGILHEGKKWIYNTTVEWANQLSVSERTITRIIKKLSETGVILIDKLSRNKRNRVNFYRIDYDKLQEILDDTLPCDVTTSSLTPDSPVQDPCVCLSPFSQNNSNYIDTKTTLHTYKSYNNDFLKSHSQEQDLSRPNPLPNSLKTPTLAQQLLDIWNDSVGQFTKIGVLTVQRAKFLVAAFNRIFQNSFAKWKAYCKTLTTSDFLMGKVKDFFKVTLDWSLKFHNIQRILDGELGVKPVSIADVLTTEEKAALSLEKKTFLAKEIDACLDVELQKTKRLLLEKLDVGVYENYFHNALESIHISETRTKDPIIELVFNSSWLCTYVQGHYQAQLEYCFDNRIAFMTVQDLERRKKWDNPSPASIPTDQKHPAGLDNNAFNPVTEEESHFLVLSTITQQESEQESEAQKIELTQEILDDYKQNRQSLHSWAFDDPLLVTKVDLLETLDLKAYRTYIHQALVAVQRTETGLNLVFNSKYTKEEAQTHLLLPLTAWSDRPISFLIQETHNPLLSSEQENNKTHSHLQDLPFRDVQLSHGWDHHAL